MMDDNHQIIAVVVVKAYFGLKRAGFWSTMKKLFLAIVVSIVISGCSPEVGSDEWCAKMREKPAGEWTQSETAEYAKNCIIKFGE